MTLLADLASWLWRLLPANPILVRVVNNGGKRQGHLIARAVYLGVLILVFWFFGGFLRGGGSLADLAKQSTFTFLAVSMVQLGLMCFIAPVFCAGAITQEKDSNTLHILLTTPLTNGQIVLGSLFSRIYFVWVLLLSGLPIFCITMIYGGVTTREVFESFGLAACTGLLTGSIAIMISFLRIGTRRTILSFFVGVAVYLIGVAAVGMSPWGQLAAAPVSPRSAEIFSADYRMSWLAPIHPFLSLMVVNGLTPSPPISDVYQHGWPWRWLLAYPQYGYMAIMSLASIVMITISLVYVRAGEKEGESNWVNRLSSLFRRQQEERRRDPRRVWANPIAWREAATRASAGGRSAARWVFIIAGIAAGIGLAIAHYSGALGLSPDKPETTRVWLTVFVWIELAVILLTVSNAAATTLTRDKESLTFEILITTPLTSKYIIEGMIRGLVVLVIPLITVPTLNVLAFVVSGLLFMKKPPVVAWEALLLVPLLITALAAVAATIGLHWSMSCKKSVWAVMISTGLVLGGSGLLWGCGLALGSAGATVNSLLLPFLPFPAMQALLDPWKAMGGAGFDPVSGATQTFDAAAILAFRISRAVATAVAVGAAIAATYVGYTQLVRSYDMTIRRQVS